MNKEFLEGLFAKAKSAKIIVIGDVMLDRYLFGNVNRISPEAPVQVFDIRENEHRLGGAANVAFNIRTLGATPVLIGITGNDNEAGLLREELSRNGIDPSGLVHDPERPTTCKTRVISDSHHLIRIDSESRNEISKRLLDEIVRKLDTETSDNDVVVIEDYNKGLLSKQLISEILGIANRKNLRVLVDPKFENFLEYKGVYLFKPNRKELEDALGSKVKDHGVIDKLAEEVMNILKCKNMLITLGEHGMMIMEYGEGRISKEILPTKARKVADVSGAGDTVISTMSVCLAAGAPLKEAAMISNYAAGLVVEEVGIVPVKREKLIQHITQQENDSKQ